MRRRRGSARYRRRHRAPVRASHERAPRPVGDPRDAEDPDDDDEADDLRDDFGGLELRRIADTPVFVLTLPPGADLDQVLKDLDDDVRVLETELNYLGEAPEGGPVNIPTLGSETLAAISGQDALRDLGLAQAHQVTRGAGILVAVVDKTVPLSFRFSRS